MIEKPLTDNLKEKANACYKYLKSQNRYCTKEEIGEFLGVKNERCVRDIISLVASKKPILSKSNSKGYKLAQTKDDLKDVDNVWREIDSRIDELNRRKQPLIEFANAFNYTDRL